jgi:asparagine synthase (glutamine-hydrolysing)
LCGICGIWFFNEAQRENDSIVAMNHSLAHRGPDAEGYYSDNGLQLAHRRLSVIDLSDAARQPMQMNDYVITYNGEVYNFPELKEELSLKGYQFKTGSDAEVILAAWQEWNVKALDRFNGMWAFAIWNKKEQQLILSRDRFGVKPLYYIYKPGQFFAFASETIAFRSIRSLKREINEKNIIITLHDPYYLEATGNSIFKDIYQLQPGHHLTVSVSSMQIQPYWNTANHIYPINTSYADQQQQFRHIWESACSLRLRSDVNIATALSGGLDSSAVYCTIRNFIDTHTRLQHLPSSWQKAVTVSFPGTGMDERRFAKAVIDHTGGEVMQLAIHNNADLAKDVVDTVLSQEFIYPSAPVVHHIYQYMRAQGITVSLDGHGADELLMGYPADILSAIKKKSSFGDKRALINIYRNMIPGASLGKRVLQKMRSLLDGDNYLTPLKYENISEQLSCNELDELQNISYRSFHYILPSLLRNWDRASMQHGVEVRMPFMDWRLVVFCLGLPFGSKVGNGFTKLILRDALKDILPPAIRERKDKIGVQAPMQQWLGGPLRSLVMDSISSAEFMQSALWNGKKIKQLADLQSKKKCWDEYAANITWPIINAHLLIQSNKK